MALGETKPRYPTQAFLVFVEAARRYIELTRHDQLVHREVAKAINNGSTALRRNLTGPLVLLGFDETRIQVPGSVECG